MPSEPPSKREVLCPYCGDNAELMDSSIVYRRSYGLIWICQPCSAWVGVHKDSKSNRPKGSLAKGRLRKLRMKGHKLFDPIWKLQVKEGVPKKAARKNTYKELSARLGIAYDDCHFAMFDEELAERAVATLCEWREEIARTRREAAAKAAASPDEA